MNRASKLNILNRSGFMINALMFLFISLIVSITFINDSELNRMDTLIEFSGEAENIENEEIALDDFFSILRNVDFLQTKSNNLHLSFRDKVLKHTSAPATPPPELLS